MSRSRFRTKLALNLFCGIFLPYCAWTHSPRQVVTAQVTKSEMCSALFQQFDTQAPANNQLPDLVNSRNGTYVFSNGHVQFLPKDMAILTVEVFEPIFDADHIAILERQYGKQKVQELLREGKLGKFIQEKAGDSISPALKLDTELAAARIRFESYKPGDLISVDDLAIFLSVIERSKLDAFNAGDLEKLKKEFFLRLEEYRKKEKLDPLRAGDWAIAKYVEFIVPINKSITAKQMADALKARNIRVDLKDLENRFRKGQDKRGRPLDFNFFVLRLRGLGGEVHLEIAQKGGALFGNEFWEKIGTFTETYAHPAYLGVEGASKNHGARKTMRWTY